MCLQLDVYCYGSGHLLWSIYWWVFTAQSFKQCLQSDTAVRHYSWMFWLMLTECLLGVCWLSIAALLSGRHLLWHSVLVTLSIYGSVY